MFCTVMCRFIINMFSVRFNIRVAAYFAEFQFNDTIELLIFIRFLSMRRIDLKKKFAVICKYGNYDTKMHSEKET